MKQPATLPAFTSDERGRVHALLGAKVAYMMGRKFEEGDWADVYCSAKRIERKGWSNLKLDVIHNNLGIEQKSLRYTKNHDIITACGNKFMHPAATRSIRTPPTTTPDEVAMRDILSQYGAYLDERKAYVQSQAPVGTIADLRTGWLMWQTNLHQFLYFEEEMLAPNPDEYTAKWIPRLPGGTRKGSTNLWIFEKESGAKRYSVTNEAGVKIQPYFNVPPVNDPNLYVFTVIGEVLMPGVVRLWITEGTARELKALAGSLEFDVLSRVVIEECSKIAAGGTQKGTEQEVGMPVFLSVEAYAVLHGALPGVSDAHSMQLLAQHLRRD